MKSNVTLSMIARNRIFRAVDFESVKSMVAILHVESELEMFKVTVAWIGSNIQERNKYANDLLKVSLPLSDDVEEYIKSKVDYIQRRGGCPFILELLKNFLER